MGIGDRMKIFKLFLLFIFFSTGIFAQIDDNTVNQMMSLSAISVTVGGEFIVNGTFPASSTERVDQFITRIYNEAKLQNLSLARDATSLAKLKEEIGDYAKRNIKLVSADGEVKFLDLEKFRLTANFDENPYLKNGDVIIFPPLDLDRNFIAISGAVNKEITFQYVEGDKLSDALLFARGINKAYDNVTKAEISRLNADGSEREKIIVDIDSDFPLERGDRIMVLAEETYRVVFEVTIQGEVNRPGKIYITKDSTTIRDAINRAGGFTELADLNNAVILRGNQAKLALKDLEENDIGNRFFSENIDLLMTQRMANVSQEDSLYFLVDNTLRISRGNINLDFNKINDPNSIDSKFVLQDGDFIYVPKKVDLVYVFGQVNNPGYIKYESGKDYQFYVDQAGGLGSTARGEVYLIKNKSRAWIDVTEENPYKIEPGDMLWAPKAPYRTFDYYLTRIGTYSTILGSLATVILLFLQVGK